MKKQFLFLIACALVFFSCSNSDNTLRHSEAQIDSTVAVTVAKHEEANAAKNDSLLKAIEKEKADSLEKIMQHSGKKQEQDKNIKPAITPADSSRK